MRPYYGDTAAEVFGDLMTTHLSVAAQLVTEAVKGAPEAAATEKASYDNAAAIVKFLAAANPNLPEPVVQSLLYEHLALTRAEAVARITKDYDADVATFDKILHQILGVSDAVAHAIIGQFEPRFA